VRDGDVPGFQIPSRYFHYVRTADPRSLVPVLEHNRLDILSLALLSARLARLLEEGAPAAQSGSEALGLGRIFERAGRTEAASACFNAAAMLAEDVETAGEALRASAVILRRARRYAEAATLWRRILDLTPCPPRLAHEAVEALAVHHEHRVRELATARRFALRSLGFTTNHARIQAAEHRLARIDRKLGTSISSPSASPLF
jgi:tetratricopeptide (TPR) repeat protein